ncbi:hypothetical protein MHYP_G00144740 [Metynnis hypsauchen]
MCTEVSTESYPRTTISVDRQSPGSCRGLAAAFASALPGCRQLFLRTEARQAKLEDLHGSPLFSTVVGTTAAIGCGPVLPGLPQIASPGRADLVDTFSVDSG